MTRGDLKRDNEMDIRLIVNDDDLARALAVVEAL
jgi:hypothetical protein